MSETKESAELIPKEKDNATRIAVTAGVVLAVVVLVSAVGLAIWKINWER